MARKKELVLNGNPLLPGVTKTTEGYNFTVRVPEGAEASLLFYKKKGKAPVKEISLTGEYRSGGIYSILLPEFQSDKYEYNYKIDGKIVQDPYAKRISGRDVFGQEIGVEEEHKVRCGFLTEEFFEWEGDKPLSLSYENMILYKLHVRGFTKTAKVPAKKKGTFSGLQEMIPYLKELGINAVELMPVYDFAEVTIPEKLTALVQVKNEAKNVNYWGYTSGFYFAPKKSYCATDTPEDEVRNLIKALHQAGIACVMELYIPKNAAPMHVLCALQYWKLFYHMDGFHLIGDGIPKDLILQDDLLKGSKIMMNWFSERDVELVQCRGRMLADYHGQFMEHMRQFLKSDAGICKKAAASMLSGSSKKAIVNYMADHDGFTMYDMVSYNEKHNESNGHENTDGTDFNFSWNCGEEGLATKKYVQDFRGKQLRNAFSMLLFSQGVPMIYAGDEFGNSQDGNNNAYCQDNETGWVDWKALKKNEDLQQFVKEAIAFRKAHPILHLASELKGNDYLMKGLPDVSFHGTEAWDCKFEEQDRLFGIMLCGDYAKCEDGASDDVIFIGYNFYWLGRELALPNPGQGRIWKKVMDTSVSSEKGSFLEPEEIFDKKVEVGPRTVVVLVGCKEEQK